MFQSDARLIATIRTVVESEGIQWDLLKYSAEQVILFGSAAVGLSNRTSDFDILCVGHGNRFKSKKLDMKWITPEKLSSPKWLTSELANHIACYGRWLFGRDDWKEMARITLRTIAFKRKLIIGRATMMENVWPFLSMAYRVKHAAKLRREFQRLQLLTQRLAVIPTPLLDFWWSCESAKTDKLKEMIKGARLPATLHPTAFEPLMVSTIYLKPVSAALRAKLRSAFESFRK